MQEAATTSEKLYDRVYSTLLGKILSGELPPGSLIREIPIAEELLVSRTPVHDAVLQLTRDGLLTRVSDRRTVVSGLSAEEVDDLFEMRKLLEVEATRRATATLDRARLQELKREADRLARSRSLAKVRRDWPDHDEAFHAAIAEACGSRRLREDILRYRLLHRGVNLLLPTLEAFREAAAEHAAILDAMLARDARGAARAMGSHLAEWQLFFVRQLRQ